MTTFDARPNRRTVLAGLAATAGIALAHRGATAAPTAPRSLRAAAGVAEMLPDDGPATAVWAYDGLVPGPLLRIPQGGRVAIRLVNELAQPTTIHWHGIRIDNRMDGVAGLTQAPVPPGGSFVYDFAVPDAGTFWYHPHHRSWEQVARGLYGVLIVEEPAPPKVDLDLPLVFDDWRIGKDGQIDAASLGSLRDWSHAGRLGNFLTVNGRFPVTQAVRAGERVRLRLVNTATARVLQLAFEGMDPQLVAIDGQPLPPLALPAGPLSLAPGQRLDLIADMTQDPGGHAAIAEVSGGGRLEAVRFAYHPDAVARRQPLDAPVALAANPLPPFPGTEGARFVDLVMEGGAMGGLRAARVGDEQLGIREMAGRGLVWAFNGVAGRPEAPLFDVARNRPVAIRMVNRTAWPHAIHLHGHHVRELDRNGQPVDDGAWRDTVLLDREEVVTVGFVADNPGDWMLHCHMLEHQAAGMSSWFRVRA